MALFSIQKNQDEEQKIIERIRMLRLNVLVHSVIYYKLGKNIITDEQFDKRCADLAEIQKKFPLISLKVKSYLKEFKNWDGKTSGGYKLPLQDKWANRKAHYLVKLFQKS